MSISLEHIGGLTNRCKTNVDKYPEPHLRQVESLGTMSCLISSMTTGVDNLAVVLEYSQAVAGATLGRNHR